MPERHSFMHSASLAAALLIGISDARGATSVHVVDAEAAPLVSVSSAVAKLVSGTLAKEAGRSPQRSAYWPIRHNDFYTGQDSSPLQAWKNRPIGESSDITLTLFGEERVRSVWQTWASHTGAGQRNQRFMLLRHQYGADLHVGDGLRFFGQLISGQQFGSNYPQPESARQSNEVDISQAFVEAKCRAVSGSLGVRAGRQQVHFGKGQVLDLEAAPNVERNFDGVRAYYENPLIKFDAFMLRPVAHNHYSFDDDTDNDAALWGLYGSLPLFHEPSVLITLDPIYVGKRDDDNAFNRLVGTETRHTFATRFWGKLGAAVIDYTLLYQAGRLEGRNIRTASVMTTTSFKVRQRADAPTLAFNLDMATGGQRDGSIVKTYKQPYMSGAYVSLNGFLSLSNMYSFAPAISFALPYRLSLGVYDRFYWRYSTDDAVYGQNFSTLAASLNTDARYIGQQPAIDLRWQATPNLQIRGSGAYFEPSGQMRAAGLRHTSTFRIDLNYVF